MRVTWREQAPEKVRKAREDAGLTQEQLAEQCGVTVNSVGHYEGGRAVPKVDTLERIAAATGKPLAWFFQADDAAEPAPAPAEPPTPQPDMQSLLAQLVAAQVRAEERQAEMSQALTALAHEQMQARAEAARTSARLTQVEEGLRAMLEAPRGGCGEDEATLAG